MVHDFVNHTLGDRIDNLYGVSEQWYRGEQSQFTMGSKIGMVKNITVFCTTPVISTFEYLH